ncbi:hypothetical protein ACJJTC_014867 [Scirpophaga incertulas]
MRVALFVLCALLAGAVRGSPHADLIEKLQKSSVTRISNNIFEDAMLDVPDLVRKSYIAFPHGRDRYNKPGPRPVVFLMHGLLSSSADWVITGPGCALGYLLVEEGFDVWMGNARGNYYSRRHERFNPSSVLNTDFWEFSWDEIGNIDLPTMIDYVLKISGRDRLHYVGHSQGTTSFWVMTSLRPEYNAKIVSMHAFAPVAYMAHNRNPLFLFLAPFGNNIEKILSVIGFGEFLPNSDAMSWLGRILCQDEATFQPLCTNILFLVGGINHDEHNSTLIPLKLGHTPAGAAARQFVHYGQGITAKQFRRYDHGSRIANRRVYGSREPPQYSLSRNHCAKLGRPVGKFLIPMPTFSHLDYIWGINAKDLLYTRTINLIKSMETHSFAEE